MARVLCEVCVATAMDENGPWVCHNVFVNKEIEFVDRWQRTRVLTVLSESDDYGTDIHVLDPTTHFALPMFAVTTVKGSARCPLHVREL